MIEKYIKQLESGFETLRAELERLKLVEAERDQLLAERKEMLVNKVFDSSDKKLLENHGFTDFIELLTAYERLIAERENINQKLDHYKIQHTAYLAEREQFVKQEGIMSAALKLAKDMFLANDLNLPRTLEVIDNALTKNEFSPPVQQGLAVFYGKMPESNGKENWTAILHRKSEDGLFGGIADGITIDRSEYPDRVRYEADCVRYLIGEIDKKPNILEYDSELHSGYVDPLEVQRMKQSATPIPIEELERVLGPDREKYGFTSIKGEGYELVIDDNRSVRGYPTSIGGVYFIFRNHDIEKHVPLSDEAIDAVLRIRTALEKGSEAEQFMFELL